MFERFTDRARRVVVLAQEEARMLEDEWLVAERVQEAGLAPEDGAEDEPGDEAPGVASGQ